jgi:hypothetical protein
LVKRDREEKRWGMQSEVRRFRPKSMQSYCRLVRVYREDILVWKFGEVVQVVCRHIKIHLPQLRQLPKHVNHQPKPSLLQVIIPQKQLQFL